MAEAVVLWPIVHEEDYPRRSSSSSQRAKTSSRRPWAASRSTVRALGRFGSAPGA